MQEANASVPQVRGRVAWNKGRLVVRLGHRKIESTVRYLGIEVDDALGIAEHVDI